MYIERQKIVNAVGEKRGLGVCQEVLWVEGKG